MDKSSLSGGGIQLSGAGVPGMENWGGRGRVALGSSTVTPWVIGAGVETGWGFVLGQLITATKLSSNFAVSACA